MRSKCLTAGGLLLLAAALVLAVWNIQEGRRAAQTAQDALHQVERSIAVQAADPPPDAAPASDANREMPVIEVDGNAYIGTVEIPTLALALPVLRDWSDALLKIAPCRYTGSVYQDRMIIAGHNYPRHFGQLDRLQIGDEVRFTDAEGGCVTYAVTQTERLAGSAVEQMASGDWDLTLFTCTAGGQERVTVRCDRTEAANHMKGGETYGEKT